MASKLEYILQAVARVIQPLANNTQAQGSQTLNLQLTQTVDDSTNANDLQYDPNIELAGLAGSTASQLLTTTAVPLAGQFQLLLAGQLTAPILFSDNAAAVQAVIAALPKYNSAAVTGSFALGFTITWTGADSLKAVPLMMTVNNTLDAGATIPSVATVVAGSSPGVVYDVPFATIVEAFHLFVQVTGKGSGAASTFVPLIQLSVNGAEWTDYTSFVAQEFNVNFPLTSLKIRANGSLVTDSVLVAYLLVGTKP